MSSIVQVNVSIAQGITPSQLQKTGAVISVGGTNTAPGTRTLIRAASDLTAIKNTAKAITSITWLANVATVTTTAAHGIPVGDTFPVTIAGAAPAGYNGTFVATSTGASTFTYPLASNPGSETLPGTWIPAAVAELQAEINTFFAQGSQQSVYVLELGIGDVDAAVAALVTYIAANPGFFYSYLVPSIWAGNADFLDLIETYLTTTSKTYFWVTCSQGQLAGYADLKAVIAMVPSPDAPSTEFSHAADFRQALNYKPSSTNKVTPFAFTYLYGVTAYPLPGNAAAIADIIDANGNIVNTGAEGGISNKMLDAGTTMDGRDFTYWYAVDWVQINVAQAVAAAIIEGSNTPQNPLYYDQNGINRLQGVIAGKMGQGTTYGIVLGAPVQVAMDPDDFIDAVENGDFAGLTPINAQPFLAYTADNPDDYPDGIYNGFQIAFTPNRGFKHIIINVQVDDLPTT